jgi:AraC-like DNA-binding protein
VIFSEAAYTWRGAALERQSALAPTWAIKRYRSHGLLNNEHVLRAIGRETRPTRARLTMVLGGRVVAYLAGQSLELGPGDALHVHPLSEFFGVEIEPLTVLELDWDCRGASASLDKIRLPESLLVAAAGLADRLRDARTRAPAFAAAGRRFFERLAASGIAIQDDTAFDHVDGPGQHIMDAVDRALGELRCRPQLVDVQARAGRSRWTLARSLHALGECYGLRGLRGRDDWRALRDFRRLLVASILMTHPQATTRAVALEVGYGSADAMCHAFANAGLPSPSQIRALGR